MEQKDENSRVAAMANYYCLSKEDIFEYEWKYKNAYSYLSARLSFVVPDIEYDVFLSHSILDASMIEKIRSLFSSCWGYKTYVDWIDDAHLKRENVNRETAEVVGCKNYSFVSSYF